MAGIVRQRLSPSGNEQNRPAARLSYADLRSSNHVIPGNNSAKPRHTESSKLPSMHMHKPHLVVHLMFRHACAQRPGSWNPQAVHACLSSSFAQTWTSQRVLKRLTGQAEALRCRFISQSPFLVPGYRHAIRKRPQVIGSPSCACTLNHLDAALLSGRCKCQRGVADPVPFISPLAQGNKPPKQIRLSSGNR